MRLKVSVGKIGYFGDGRIGKMHACTGRGEGLNKHRGSVWKGRSGSSTDMTISLGELPDNRKIEWMDSCFCNISSVYSRGSPYIDVVSCIFNLLTFLTTVPWWHVV